MNWAICKNTWTEILRNKLRLTILLFVFLSPIIGSTTGLCAEHVLSEEAFDSCEDTRYFVLIWGIGTIGRQVQDGTLSLLLSRPLMISKLVTSKWFAVAVASSITSILQLMAELLVAFSRNQQISVFEAATNGVERVLVCIGLSAVVILLSSLVTGVKDIGLYVLLSILNDIFKSLAAIEPDPSQNTTLKSFVVWSAHCAGSVYRFIQECLVPKIDLQMCISLGSIPWHELSLYLAIIATSLSLAIYTLNRKEFPYGSA
jgi:ABC-type transport system involved in multi-copper enzyme maturation permease subunit